MTSKAEKEAFVWIWLPNETEPVVAGRLEADNGFILFNYGKSYLNRVDDSKPAIAIYNPELPLKAGILPLLEGLTMPGCIRDAAPDAWGRRVIINKKSGIKGTGIDTAELDELTYLLESGSDRIGALDFQRSPTEYVPRSVNNVSMEELIESAKRVEEGVLLIERFDREAKGDKWARKAMVSALTLFCLDDMMARYASYETLAEIIRHRFTKPKATLKELFSRLIFNILCGNTDDHARNHAAFWDGKTLTLTPAYDICPQGRTGNEASQAMLISGDNNLSQLKTCLQTAHNYLLSEEEAQETFGHLTAVIERHWDSICEEAELNEVDKNLLWRRQFLNPFSIE